MCNIIAAHCTCLYVTRHSQKLSYRPSHLNSRHHKIHAVVKTKSILLSGILGCFKTLPGCLRTNPCVLRTNPGCFRKKIQAVLSQLQALSD